VWIAVCDGAEGPSGRHQHRLGVHHLEVCIIYLIRDTFRYASRKYSDQIAHDLLAGLHRRRGLGWCEEVAEKWANHTGNHQ
jgi:hypothetical protein